jgi:hypothetical protein
MGSFMDLIEYIRREHAGMRRMVEITMQGMTPELFTWPAPGTANTISTTFPHYIAEVASKNSWN